MEPNLHTNNLAGSRLNKAAAAEIRDIRERKTKGNEKTLAAISTAALSE
jgi:hypothetical protein